MSPIGDTLAGLQMALLELVGEMTTALPLSGTGDVLSSLEGGGLLTFFGAGGVEPLLLPVELLDWLLLLLFLAV